jgi:hypothetical protein
MRLIVAISLILASGAVLAVEQKVVGPNGKTIGLILDCNSCKNPEEGKDCESGVQDGFHDGKRCGQCLMTANFGTRLLYPYDLYFSGNLQQPDGTPLADEFVRLYLPNTWTVRTRTTEKGFFRLVLGATQDREGSEVQVDLGTRTRKKAEGASDYALYMLPENYKPCPAE